MRSFGDLIDRYRRHPKHCLYCEAEANSLEHCIPNAIGGRLAAYILCGQHNNEIGRIVDGPNARTFAPLVNMLSIARQDGTVGVPFTALTDAREAVTISRDGSAQGRPLVVTGRDTAGRIVQATGDLARLDALAAQGALSDEVRSAIIATVEAPPVVNFQIATDHAMDSLALKIATHFVASFVSDVDLRIARGLLPYVLGDQLAGGVFARTEVRRNDQLFQRSWPPRHEVTCYPRKDVTYGTVLLFGQYAYIIRLPFVVDAHSGLRYTQVLTERVPRFYEGVANPEIDWDHDFTANELELFREDSERWQDDLTRFTLERQTRRRIETAARIARAREGEFWSNWRAELQLQVLFNAGQIAQIIELGRRMVAAGREPWEFHITINQLTE